MKSSILFLFLNFLLIKCADVPSKISIDGEWFVDKYGRTKLFRGINAIRKTDPWLPNEGHIDLTNDTQLDNLQKWGFNVVRLGLMWSGLKPTKDTIDQDYLNEIIAIINRLAFRGIYVIIDLHQEMMSTKFDSYDGFPRWLIDSMPNSTHEFPWPLNDVYHVIEPLLKEPYISYLTEACSFAFQNLYDNINEFQYYFNEYWSVVSTKLAKRRSILAFELINEPWAGNIFANPDLLSQTTASTLNLLPLYDKISETIRENDNDTIIFYMPVTWGVNYNAELEGIGFKRAPGNDNLRTALSWHYLCWFNFFDFDLFNNGAINNFGPKICNEKKREKIFNIIDKDMSSIGSPSFLTEFGNCAKTNSDGILQVDECKGILNAADNHFLSWTYLESDFYKADDTVNQPLVEVFSRVYPMSTNGIPVNFTFDSNTKVFSLFFILNAKIKVPSEIFIPDHVYPHGFKITLTNHLMWTFHKETNILKITNAVNSKDQALSSILLKPK